MNEMRRNANDLCIAVKLWPHFVLIEKRVARKQHKE